MGHVVLKESLDLKEIVVPQGPQELQVPPLALWAMERTSCLIFSA
jgi:hypothetical protein